MRRFSLTVAIALTASATMSAPSYIARTDVPALSAKFASAADFDGDGNLDVAALSIDDNYLVVYYGRGDGTLAFPPEFYVTDEKPIHLAVGDLTDDGITSLPDILVVTQQGQVPGLSPPVRGDLTIFQNSGAGPNPVMPRFSTECPDIFLDGTGQTAGNNPGYALVHDFDLDASGLLDIVSASEFGNSIQSFYQGHTNAAPTCVTPATCNFGYADNGNQCTPAVTFQGNPRSLVKGRFLPLVQGDPLVLDVVALNTFSGVITYHIHLNAAPEQFFAVGGGSTVGGIDSSMMIGTDLNADGIPDLIVSNRDSNDVSVLLALNPNNFIDPIFAQPSVEFPAFDGPEWLAAGEFELGPSEPGPPPGFADIVVANNTTDQISTLAGRNDGTLFNPQCYPAGDGPASIEVHDFNVDGLDDLLVSNRDGQSLSLILGRTPSNGGFDLAYRRRTGGLPGSLVAADVNGDGLQDVVLGNVDTSDLAVLLGRDEDPGPTFVSEGRFEEICVRNQFTGIPVGLASGSFDGDANDDVAVVTWGMDELRVMLGTPGGWLSNGMTIPLPTVPSDVAVGALNPSAPTDPADIIIALPVSQALLIFDGVGDGTFTVRSPPLITTIAANQLEIANLDGNPGLDLLILDDSASSLQLFRNDGNGGFVGDPMFSTSQALANNLTVGDVDGALGLDIVVTHDGGEIVVMLGDGVGGFTAQPAIDIFGPVTFAPSAPVVGDFTGDGIRDVMVLLNGSDIALTLPWSAAIGNLDLTQAEGYGTGTSPAAAIAGTFDQTNPALDTLVIADTGNGIDGYGATVLSGSRWQSYPTADAGADCFICTATPTPVPVGAPGKTYVDYAWSPAAGLSDPAIAAPTATAGGTYTVTATNPQTGQINMDEVTITEMTAPVIDILPNPAQACTGSGANFVLDAGAGYVDYAWDTGDEGRFLAVSPSVDTTYSVTVTNAAGCSTIASRDVQIVPGATVRAAISPPNQCDGNPSVFIGDASATVAPPVTTLDYLWTIVTAGTTGWTVATPTAAVTNITAAPGRTPAQITVRLEITAQPAGCISSQDFDIEVIPSAGVVDAGNSLFLTRVPGTGMINLVWGDSGASGYEVFGVDDKTIIPTILANSVTTTAVPNTQLTPAQPRRFYQANGTCP